MKKLEERGIHLEWIWLLETSQLANFSDSNLHLGVIVQPKCKWLNDIPNMIRANIPLWFLWNDPEDFSKSLIIYSKCCPTRDEVRVARPQQQVVRNAPDIFGQTFSGGDWTSYPTDVLPLLPAPAGALPLPASNEQFPKPDPFSGQRRGETMKEFFDRCAMRHVLIEQRESPAEKTSWLDHEWAACDQRCPGRGACVQCFTWDEVDRFMMQTYLVHGAIKDNWGSYAPSQRRYDSLYNKWDLAIVFDPEASVEDDDEDKEDNFMILQSDTPPPLPPYPPSPSPPHAIFTNDINTTY